MTQETETGDGASWARAAAEKQQAEAALAAVALQNQLYNDVPTPDKTLPGWIQALLQHAELPNLAFGDEDDKRAKAIGIVQFAAILAVETYRRQSDLANEYSITASQK